MTQFGKQSATLKSERTSESLRKIHPGGQVPERIFPMTIKNVDLLKFAVLAAAMASLAGCATKNYVRTQTAPIIDQTNQLNQKTADNNRAIHDTDDRATAGIQKAQGAADTATTTRRALRKLPATPKPQPMTPFTAPTRWPA